MQIGISYSQGDVFKIKNKKTIKTKNGYIRLLYNVTFTKKDLVIKCDSAHFYKKAEKLIAYNNVKMKTNDGLTVTGDQLNYYLDTKKSIISGDVEMIDKNIILKTTELHYNLKSNNATYYKSADIKSKTDETTIYSIFGAYNAPKKTIYFKDSVVITSDNTIIKSDSVDYFMSKKTSILRGPSYIYSDENTIYTEHGLYDDLKDVAILDLNPVIYTNDAVLKADSIYYNKTNRIAKAYKNIHLKDSSNKIDGYGDFAIYNEITKTSILTDKPWIKQLSDKGINSSGTKLYDTLYVHADSLKYINDSVTKEIWGYSKVKMYRADIQTMSDTLYFNQNDSVIHLIKNPIVWEKDNQLFGKKISVYFKNKKINNVKISNGAFVVSKPFKNDEESFNQVKGDSINALFKNSKLHIVYVYGFCQTRYFPSEEDENKQIKKTGLNTTESSDIIVYAKNGTIDRITFTDTPDGKMMPLKDINPKLLYLNGFIWLDDYRPKKWQDIFKWKELNKELIK